MDEVRIKSSLPVSPLARRAVTTANPSAIPVVQSHDADVAQAQVVDEQGAPSHRDQVEAAVKRLNDHVQTIQRGLRFDYDETTAQTIIKVVDSSTNEVIRQIPDEVALELARSLGESSSMSLLNVQV